MTALADVLPLSPLQEGLFFHAAYDDSATDVYTVQVVLALDGELDRAALRAAARTVLARHPNLRAGFWGGADGRPVQFIPVDGTPSWHEADLAGLPEPEQAARTDELLEEERRHRFDLARPPLLRFTLVRLGPARHLLVLTNHHILLDGWSLPILLRELFTVYTDGDAGRLPEPVPYRDYLAWLAARDPGPSLAAWSEALDGLAEPTRVAPTAPRDHRPAPPGRVTRTMSEDVTAALGRLTRDHGLTLGTLVQGAFGIVLGRLTGRRDVVFGATVSGRPPHLPGVERMVGLFINTVPERFRWERAEPALRALTRLQDEQLALAPHHHVSLTGIHQAAGVRELFDAVVVVENYPAGGLAEPAPGLTVTPISGQDAAHYPLMLVAVPGERLHLRLDHQEDLLDTAETGQIADLLVQVLTELAADPGRPMGGLASSAPRGGHGPVVELPAVTVPGLFAAQVARAPDAPALLFPERVTFAELNARANRLAHVLVSAGAGPERPVALALPRATALVVALLGTLKAGAPYLPVDLRYPAERVRSMLEDGAPALVVTDRANAAGLPGDLLVLDDPGTVPRVDAAPDHDPDVPLTGESAAYLLYTSGSTGEPKGVVGTHVGLTNRLHWAGGLRHDGPACAKSSLSFVDGSTELLGPLVHGRPVVLTDAADPSALGDLVAEHRAGALTAVPSLIGVLLDEDSGDPARYTSCRLWISSGEPLPAALADRLAAVLPGSRLYNLYGCTEVSGDSLAAECRPGGELPLGRPLQNTRCYVLDQDLRPVPEGRAGELYLAGAGVARGYQRRPRATSERFVADPFGVPGARMYRTGDLVRRKPGGDLEYLGRTDAQVKIRGMRVEPAEVESELLRDTSVARAVVAARRETLVAYVCPVPGEDPDPAALRDAAAARLPEHMVPRAVVVLDALPALPNGKIDRAALPEPGPAALNGRAPSTPHQDLLCELFAEVLGLPKVGVDDDFFELGGHSLTATRLAGRIRSALGATVSPRSLFTAPTPARLAARLGLGTRDDAFEVLLPLRTTGTAPPLFCVHPAGGLAWCYAGLLRHLGADQPVYGVQAHGLTQPARSPATVGEMAAAYVEEIRTVAPDGPYRLLGWSFGGAVAHAMATLLQEGGERVELLAFMDAYPREGLPETGELDQDTVLRLLLSDYFGITAPADGPLDPGRTARLLDEAGQVSFGAADLTAIAGLLAANSRLVREFTPRTFKGDLVFFRARFGWDGDGPSSALWTPYVTGEVVEHPISCTHGTMARPGPLAEVGRLLTTTTKGISQP